VRFWVAAIHKRSKTLDIDTPAAYPVLRCHKPCSKPNQLLKVFGTKKHNLESDRINSDHPALFAQKRK